MLAKIKKAVTLRLALLALAASHASSPIADAEPASPHHARSGGVLQESYHYHRPLPYAPLADVPRYSYGFPVPSYKWGWFGAQHYYPRTTSHRGYNGDYWQWAYRRGY
jgi:hypothetical protein